MKNSSLTQFIRVISPSHKFIYWISITFIIIQLSILTNQSKAQQAPVADFTCAPMASTDCYVNFTDLSTNNPTSWFWDFGDGGTETIQNPTHTYQSTLPAGIYTITLVALNAFGSDTAYEYIYWDPNTPMSLGTCEGCNDLPIADFSCSPAFISGNCEINFTDLSSNNTTSWFWDFGDGNTDTVQNPWHFYPIASPETYIVTLVAINAFGSDTSTGTIQVDSSDCQCYNNFFAIVADFAVNNTIGCAPFTVYFYDFSTGSPTSWLWNFGDGNTDTVQNTVHTYTDTGTYDVSLIVSNGFAIDTLLMIAHINVEPPPTANAGADQTVCSSNPNAILNGVITNATGCLWTTSGTGIFIPNDTTCNTTYLSSPADTAMGYVIIELTSTGNGTCSPASDTLFIAFIPWLPVFFTSVDETCMGSCDGSAIVNVLGDYPPYTFLWDDPLSQTDSTATDLCAGTYSVTITDSNGCTVTDSVTITEPSALLLTTGSIDATCGNTDGSAFVAVSGGTSPYTYLWNDSGSQITDTATALLAGLYSVTVTDANGCIDSVAASVNDFGAPIVSILSSPDSAGIGVGMAWVTISGGTPPYSYLWNDPASQTTDTASNLLAGIYNILVTDSNGCNDSSSATVGNFTGISDWVLENNIRIYPNPNPGMFNLEIGGIEGIGEVRVLNILAKEIYKEFVAFDKQILTKNGTYRKEIDLTNQPNGIYIFQLHIDSGVITRKVVVNSFKY